MSLKIIKDSIKKRLNISDNIILLLFGAYFIATPFYLWQSGIPQAADFILLLSMGIYFVKSMVILKIKREDYFILIVSLLFSFWITLVNLVWVLLLQTSSSFMLSTSFYIFNVSIYIYTILLLKDYEEKIYSITYKMLFVSMAIETLVVLYNGGFNGIRVTGTFNNPNQLGYYSIIAIALLIIISDKLKTNTWLLIISFFFSFFLVLLSLSNAAIITWIFQFSFFILSKFKKNKVKIILFSLLSIFFFSFLFTNSEFLSNNDLYKSVETRLMKTEDKVANVSEERGYNRIKNYPQYWIVGAGEGAYYRFDGYTGEFHSILGNIQVSYGIIGTILFLSLLYFSLKKNGFQYWYLIFSILLYGYSHNGIRNSMMWMLLAFVYCTNNVTVNKNINKNRGI